MKTVAFILALLAVPAMADNEASNPWSQMAETDLEFINDLIGANHPGPVDESSPGFQEWFRTARARAQSELPKVRSLAGYKAVLQAYVAGSRDGHLSLNFHIDYRYNAWPGFVIAWRNDAFRVHSVAQGDQVPRAGDSLLACDGTGVEQLFEQRVLRFRGLGIPADRAWLAPEILLDRVNPLLERPVACRFSGGDGEYEVTLDWSWVPRAELGERTRDAALGSRPEFGSRETADGGLWLNFPSFGPAGAELEKMQAIMASLPEARGSEYVVVDVRGNSGGSSWWAEAFVRGLYGDGYWEVTDRGEEGYAVYRVSDANIEHFENLDDQILAQAGEDSEFYRYFKTLVGGLREASEAGQDLYAHRYGMPEESGKEGESVPAPPLYENPVYFLTDGRCASACLDFADVALRIPGVVHVGQHTSADTLFMEIRSATLPSRNGRISFATKVYRGRARGHNEYYAPRYEWKGNIWDTPKIEAWISALQSGGAGG